MSHDLKPRADEHLDAALAGALVQDPRPFYRVVLKHLRDRTPEAFDRASAYYASELVPAVASGADPLAAWLEYGQRLARELGSGRTVVVDETGRSAETSDPAGDAGLVLFLPDDAGAPALALRCPAVPSPAQRATLELLVEGRLTASAYD